VSRKKQPEPPPDFPPEDRRAEAATIAWMLCTLFTFCAEAVGLISKIVLSSSGGDPDQPLSPWRLLPDVTLFMGLVTGTVVLVLTPVVYRLRRTPPPESIGFVAVLIGLTPLATLLIQWLRG
jgi:hypothetical protein